MRLFGHHSSDCNCDCKQMKSTNPNPYNYKVLEATMVRNLLVVKINYPDCTNYEGNKILVFHNAKLEDFINLKSIDPHFSKNEFGVHPIARFQPTDDGMKMAVIFCHAWYADQNPPKVFR